MAASESSPAAPRLEEDAFTQLTPTLYIGRFIQCADFNELEIWHDAAVGVNQCGRIDFVLPTLNEFRHSSTSPNVSDINIEKLLQTVGWDSMENVDVVRIDSNDNKDNKCEQDNDRFFFPGFVDAHNHAPQYGNLGIFGQASLLDWLNTYTFPLEACMQDDEKALQIYTQAVQRSLSHGTTTAAYFATIHVPATKLLADICLSNGQRAFIGRVCMDRDETCPEYLRDESYQSALTATADCVKYIREIDPTGLLLASIITPRFAPSCTDACLTGLGHYTKQFNSILDSSPNNSPLLVPSSSQPEVSNVNTIPKPESLSQVDPPVSVSKRKRCNDIESIDDLNDKIHTKRLKNETLEDNEKCSVSSTTLSPLLHLRIQSHIGETRDEAKLVKKLFPKSPNYASVYDSAGLLTKHTILAHGIYLNQDEVNLLKSRETSIIHCPLSNAALSSGIARIRHLLNNGVTVGLGSDVSAGYSPSILLQVRHAILTSRILTLVKREFNSDDIDSATNDNLSISQALYLATCGGAKSLGLTEHVGLFKKGYFWDAQYVNLRPSVSHHSHPQSGLSVISANNLDNIDLFPWLDDFDTILLPGQSNNHRHRSWNRKIAKWAYTADDRHTLSVWVRGRQVYRREACYNVKTGQLTGLVKCSIHPSAKRYAALDWVSISWENNAA